MALQPRGTPILLEPLPTPAPLQIHVTGAVQNPGMYTFPPGARVAEAITRAGGLISEANPDAVNLAAVLRDGQQVYVPRHGEEAPSVLSTDRQGLMDLNTATLEELMELPGIGPEKAQDILSHREQLGGFNKIEELMDVPGIGQATFDQLKSLVTVSTN